MARIFTFNYIIIANFYLSYSQRDQYIFQRKKNRNNDNKVIDSIKSWTRSEVLKDFKFYTILPAMLASSFIITGIVINQTFIIESKDWGKYAMAQSFMIYSILTVATLFFREFWLINLLAEKFFQYLTFLYY